MLIFGNEIAVKGIVKDEKTMSNTILFNLSNALEVGIELYSLIPPFVSNDDKDFDINYANYILQSDKAFISLMNVIISLYSGNDVYVLIDHDVYRDCITESILKFISERYGYNGCIIHEESDLETVVDGDFSIQGLFNLDVDKERYTKLTTTPESIARDFGE
jgi:hypothetical protein